MHLRDVFSREGFHSTPNEDEFPGDGGNDRRAKVIDCLAALHVFFIDWLAKDLVFGSIIFYFLGGLLQ